MPAYRPSRRDFLGSALLTTPAFAATPLNIVLIYADDLGYGDLGCYGGPIRTPNLDALARGGMRFTHFYSANPVCSPSRAALLTGRYPTRAGVPRVLFPSDREGLPQSEITLAQMLKSRQYRTMCVGKWHLGHMPEYLPTSRGFDRYLGIPYSNDMSPRPLLRDRETVETEATLETLTPRYTEAAVQFIRESAGSPFFLYMPHTYPHIPLAASPKFRGHSPQGIYGDVIEELDWSVGQVVDAVKKSGQEKNTLILFSSDNGPWYQGSPGVLRGRKGMTWEGGMREPMIASLPGRIPAGQLCDGIACTIDLVPTLAGLCGFEMPNPVDGVDIWPLLSGRKKSLDRDPLLYFDDVHLQCARSKQWKIHLARYNSVTYSPAPASGRLNLPLNPPELYDVVADVSESYDVAAAHPEIVADLKARIERMMAGFPQPIRDDWAATKTRKTRPAPAGQVTRAL